jgi:glutamyl-tRNA synthetase
VQERVGVLKEVPWNVEFLFAPELEIDAASWDKAVARDESATPILESVRAGFESVSPDDWDAPALKDVLTQVAEEHGRKLGKAQAPVRVAALGRSVGLPLFESLQVLGRDETLRRIAAALDRLAAPVRGDA